MPRLLPFRGGNGSDLSHDFRDSDTPLLAAVAVLDVAPRASSSSGWEFVPCGQHPHVLHGLFEQPNNPTYYLVENQLLTNLR